MSLSITFCISLILSIALIPLFVRFAPKLGLVDVPDGIRKIHTNTIPRCGGIAIAVASLLPATYFLQQIPVLMSFVGASLIVVIFGYLDDRFDLSYKWKFIGQIVATIILLLTLPEISRLPFFLEPTTWAWLGYSGIFLFVIATTNAVNLTDGLDGLAGGTILLSLALIAYLAWVADIDYVALMAIALIGALLGFLRYNTHPATVFMGDTGSQFIGFSTAVLGILLTQDHGCALSPILPLMIVGLPLIDTVMVMAVRIKSGRSPFSADKNHIHHQLIHFGFRHYEAVAIIYVIQISFILLAFFLRYASDFAIFATYVLYANALLMSLYGLNKAAWKFRVTNEQRMERRNLLLRKFSFMHVYGPCLVLMLLVALWGFLAATSSVDSDLVPTIAMTAAVIAIVLLVINRPSRLLFLRASSYLASAACAYVSWGGLTDKSLSSWPDIITLSIAAALALSILVTRRDKFRLDNQDMLILALISGASLLPLSAPPDFGAAQIMVRLVIMLYAVEYLIHSLEKHAVWLQAASWITLFIFAFNI